MSILDIILTSIVGIILLAVVIYYVVLAIKNKWFSKILDVIKNAIIEAETKFTSPNSGPEKKAYVLNAVSKKCEELGIPVKLLYNTISKYIDDVINKYNLLSKK